MKFVAFSLTNVPTRVNNLGGTLIDHFYYSYPQIIFNSNVLLSDISDHFPLYVKLKYCNQSKTNINSKIQFCQDFSKINTQKLMIDTSKTFNKFKIYKLSILKTQYIQSLNAL